MDGVNHSGDRPSWLWLTLRMAVPASPGASGRPPWLAHAFGLVGELVRRQLDEGHEAPDPAREIAVLTAGDTGDITAGEDRFGHLVRRIGLSMDNAEVLALLVAVELDTDLQQIVAWLQDDPLRRHVTIDLLRRAFPPPHPGPLAVGDGSLLIRSCLATVDAAGPFAARRVVLAPALVWTLLGDETPDPGLDRRARFVSAPDAEGDPLTIVTGDDPARRVQTATERTAGGAFVQTPLPATDAAWEATVREATLIGGGVILDVDRTLPVDARWWIERTPHLSWSVSTPRELPLDEVPRRDWVEHRAPAGEVLAHEWEELVGADVPHRHPLRAEQLRLALPVLRATGDLDEAVRRLTVGPMDGLAIRIRPRRGWADLVVASDRQRQLRELVERYQHRHVVHQEWGFERHAGPGVVGLFSGPSGTGKTLAAEVLAGSLGVDLYRIDLASIVSKYIGETEKNLERIFDAASGGNMLLLFDEADALFGKRSEVSDARDRYANIEVSYLLQRLEAFGGLAILTTNFPKNLDPAFLRRIDYRIEFVAPGVDERTQIWENLLATGAPVDGVDVPFLAERFEITGASILNIVYTAAFLAAAGGTSITMREILLGIEREYRKLGRLRSSTDLGPYGGLLGGDGDDPVDGIGAG